MNFGPVDKLRDVLQNIPYVIVSPLSLTMAKPCQPQGNDGKNVRKYPPPSSRTSTVRLPSM